MTMYNGNIFSYEYISYNRTCGIQSWKNTLIKKRNYWQVVYF